MAQKNPQIIGINTLFMIPNEVGGTEYHLRSFLLYLEKMDRKNQYVIFCNRENYSTFHFTSDKWKKVECPVSAKSRGVRLLYEQIFFPILVRKFKCDLLHSFGYFGPILGVKNHYVTVHDTNWKDHPEDFSFLAKWILKLLCELNIFTAKKIITDSDFSANRILRHFPQSRKKLVIVKPGIDDAFYLELKKNIPTLIKQKYILCVSAFYPHKNITYLLKLWTNFQRNNSQYRLVLVGNNGTQKNEVLKRLQFIKNCSYFSKVSFSQLVNLYKNAELFIFPSTYEGFGYPVYEALSARIPVVVGNKSLYSEVVADNLNLLQFIISKDSLILKKLLLTKNSNKKKHFFSYADSVEKLIKTYQEIS